EVAVQELTGVLGVVAFGDRGEPNEIGEEDGDEATLGDGGVGGCCLGLAGGDVGLWRAGGACGRRVWDQRRGALTAEEVARVVGRAALWAGKAERRRASSTKLTAWLVLGSAVGADHD